MVQCHLGFKRSRRRNCAIGFCLRLMGRRPKPRWRGVPQQEAASMTAKSAHDARI